MSISIFGGAKNMTTAEVVANNFDVVFDEEAGICVKIAFNKGKGTGAQLVPVDEYRGYVDAIGELAETGNPTEQQLQARLQRLDQRLAELDETIAGLEEKIARRR